MHDDHWDRGVYVLCEAVTVADDTLDSLGMLVFRSGHKITLTAEDDDPRPKLLEGQRGAGRSTSGGISGRLRKIGLIPRRRYGAGGDRLRGRFQLPSEDGSECILLPDHRTAMMSKRDLKMGLLS